MPGPQVWLLTLIAALTAALGRIIAIIPSLLGAIVILLIGWGIGKLVQWLVTKGLRALHFNDLTARAGINQVLRRADIKTGPSAILGIIAYWFIFLIAVNAAVGLMGIPALTNFMNAVILFLPRIFAALLIIVFGAWAASLLADITRSSASAANISYADLLGNVVMGAALFFVFAIALDVLGLAFPFLTTAFAIIVGGLALAAAVAFGLGGREYASDVLAGRQLRAIYQAGDRITADDYEGTIQEIQPTMTILRTTRGEMSVQNSKLMNQHHLIKGQRGQGGSMPEAA
ncbi:MAG: mechanosensitive ion channel family protein [Armatimonadota bacterium]